MPTLVLDLSITPDEFLRVYQGQAKAVSAISVDGRRVQFPAAVLRPYLLHEGIQGRFEIEFDSEHKFAGIRRLN
ncbi:MAG: hypothetical protein CME36_19360 [unclassified Hahellaceae]|nr:hypothetical protein [Hahellaceae bacterium]|tara:strand:- start:46051 stop:46272 length:222 start_codon:yes stop_codon:yes gene_type:complete